MIDPKQTTQPTTMNEKTDTTETLAAILREMRDFADHRAADAGGERPGIELLRSYADRIEAAAKQEAIDAELKWTRIGYDERKAEEKRAPGNAAAVNERDRLRDIVRRLVEYADAVTGYRHRTIEVVSSEHPAWTFDGAALLREASAALGEGETPTGKGVER